MNLSRRGFLSGIIAAAVAPAIVRATSIMPVRSPKIISGAELFAHQLRVRMIEAKEIMGANILNNQFSGDLNEDSLLAAEVDIKTFREHAGLSIGLKPKQLWVAPELALAAARLLNSGDGIPLYSTSRPAPKFNLVEWGQRFTIGKT